MYVPPKETEANKIPGDAAHFIRTEIDSTDFKKTNLVSKMKNQKMPKLLILQKLLKLSKTSQTYNHEKTPNLRQKKLAKNIKK